MTISLGILLAVCASLLGYGARSVIEMRRRKVAAPQTSEVPVQDAASTAAEAIVIAVPEPFGHAHARAALASLVAAITYVRERLAERTKYGYLVLEKHDATALAWMLETLAPLPAAIGGDPRWGSVELKRHLRGLDAALAPGSWWHASQPTARDGLSEHKAIPVPVFEAVYDAVFREHVSKRLARKAQRRQAKRAVESSLVMPGAFAIGRVAGVPMRGDVKLASCEDDF